MKTDTKLKLYCLVVVLSVLFVAAVGPVVNRLRDLQDVRLSTTPSNGDVLAYNSSISRWSNSASSGGSSGSSSTNPASQIFVTNIYSTNITVITITSVTNLYAVAKGGHLTVQTNITIMTNASITFSNLAWPSVLVIGADGNVTNAILSGLTLVGNTLTASGGGSASPWLPNTPLTYSGTNVTIDGSGGTNFYLSVTGTTFFATPSNIPASASSNTAFTVFFKMTTAGSEVTWTNGSFKFPGGPTAAFQPDTNANAISWVNFYMSPVTNGIFVADYGVLASQ